MKRRALCIVVLGGLVQLTGAAATPVVVPPMAALPIAAPDDPLYATPTRLDRIGRILAPVMINGRGPYRLVVDTGANQSVLTTRLLADLGLLVSADQPVTLNGVTGSAMVPTALVQTLQTGDLIRHDLTLPVLDNVMGGADGILGMEDLDGKRITVDFARDRILIERSRGQRASWAYLTIPATLRFGRLLVVNARVGGLPVKAVIDTGAERTLGNLALRDALLRRHSSDPEFALTQVIGLTAAEQAGEIRRTPVISLGEAEVSGVNVTYGDIYVFKLWKLEHRPAMLIGMDILGLLDRLIIDYRRGELQIRRR
jgi:predicted aspartyl protease